jgi:large subunit ribosomal protein L14
MKFIIKDNSGGLEAQLIRILKSKKGEIGDLIVVSVTKAVPNKKVKKGDVLKGIILTTKPGIKRRDGNSLKFNDNSIALLGTDFNPIGTRIFGPIPLEIQHSKKIANIVGLFL